MRKPSSPSVVESYRGERVRVFRLDGGPVLAALRQRAQALVDARPEVLEVRLFGSLARGAGTPGSDADLWVLMRDGAPPFLARAADLARHFEGAGVACHVLAYTESEWAALGRARRRIVGTVAAEGIALARRR
jgi:predicted nucleotidyltransferase